MQEDKKYCCEENKKNQFIEELFLEYKPSKDNLIQILNEIQEHYGYIPIEVQKEVSEFLSIPMAEIYGVVTFYSRFSLKPKGKYKKNKNDKKRRCIIFYLINNMCRSMWFSTIIYSKWRSIWKSDCSKIGSSFRWVNETIGTGQNVS